MKGTDSAGRGRSPSSFSDMKSSRTPRGFVRVGKGIMSERRESVWESGGTMMTKQPVYRRVVLKLSGEALAGTSGFGVDLDVVK